jgi:prepilin-type N-terminal cleavage/methylation domain-containing protein
MTNSGQHDLFDIHHSVIPSKFGIRHSSFGAEGGFTLIELLVVIAIIIILAGLILTTAGYVQRKGARARAETEIAAMSAAIESYKADNGIYPRNGADTDALPSNSDPAGGDPTQAAFQNASLYLYKELSGDHDANRSVNAADDLSGNGVIPKTYFTFKPNMLSPTDQILNVKYIRDPFGNSYGYSTFESANPASANGNNPTFDLWSTVGETGKKTGETFTQYQQRWIKNW